MPDKTPDKTPEKTADKPRFDYSAGAAELRGEVYRTPEYVTYLDRAVAAMRMVRMIVYAGMAGFLLLAAYGFVLIYRLTEDVHSMVHQSVIITEQMQAMTRTIANLNHNVTGMTGSMDSITVEMAAMQADIARMSGTVTLMQHSAANLDRSMSPLTGTMSRMIPFGWSGYPGAPPYAR